MAILKILQYPDDRLHIVATTVKQVTDSTRKLIKDMAETMYAAPGIGLAATQVDQHLRTRPAGGAVGSATRSAG